MTRAGIVNVTGYAGVELARLLAQHPEVELISVTGRSAAGRELGDVFPHLESLGLTIEPELGECDIAFSAMPHKESAAGIIPLLERGVRVIDISADFRLNDPKSYPKWYGFTHPAPELLAKAVYGVPELYREAIKSARLVANTGCYAVSAILALAPAVKEGLIGPDIIIDSKSGTSGAGRSLSLTTHYAEVNEDVTAYATSGHRHLPEIVQELAKLRPEPKPSITFLPHLIPMTRGILTSAYAPFDGDALTQQELVDIYRGFYKESPFVRVLTAPPHTKHTWGSNYCHIYPTLDLRTGRFMVMSAIDNLVKGAAGQAVQNMNLMLGLPETTGIQSLAVFP